MEFPKSFFRKRYTCCQLHPIFFANRTNYWSTTWPSHAAQSSWNIIIVVCRAARSFLFFLFSFLFSRPFATIAILGTMKRFSFLTRFPDNSTYNYSTIISLLLAYSGNCIVITRLVFPNARWIERFNVRENKEIRSYSLLNNRVLGRARFYAYFRLSSKTSVDRVCAVREIPLKHVEFSTERIRTDDQEKKRKRKIEKDDNREKDRRTIF